MANEIKDSLIETIRALKEMSETSANEHEAIAAAACAQRLLLLHNLKWDEVEGSSDGSEEIVVSEETYTFLTDKGKEALKVSPWRVALSRAIAKACLCRLLLYRGRRYSKVPCRFTFVGRVDNVKVAVYLMSYLQREIMQLTASKRREEAGYRGMTYWNSYQLGIVATLGAKLESEMDAFKGQSSQTMALVSNRRTEVSNYIKQHYGKLTRGPQSHSQMDDGAFNRGLKDGHDIQIHRGISGESNGAGQRLIR